MTNNHVVYSFFKIIKFLQILVMKHGRKIITRAGDGKLVLFEFQGPYNLTKFLDKKNFTKSKGESIWKVHITRCSLTIVYKVPLSKLKVNLKKPVQKVQKIHKMSL